MTKPTRNPHPWPVVAWFVLAILAACARAEAQPAKIPGFGYPEPRPGACACLRRDGVVNGPILGYPFGLQWGNPFPSRPGKPANQDHVATMGRYRMGCRQPDGTVMGYPPGYTGEPGSRYGPEEMSRRCKNNDFGTGATHDCEYNPLDGRIAKQFHDWNAQQFPCACSPGVKPWFCPGDGAPTTPPPPLPDPLPTPAPQPPPVATPVPPGVPAGCCQTMFGLQCPCQPVTSPTPAPQPTPTPPPVVQPTPTPQPCPSAPPCPSCQSCEVCKACPPPVVCPTCPPPIVCETCAPTCLPLSDITEGTLATIREGKTPRQSALLRLQREVDARRGCVLRMRSER